MDKQIKENTPIYQQGSVDAILDTAKSIYNEEVDRFKQIEAKTSITLTFMGVLFGVFLTYLGAFKPQADEIAYLIYTYLFKCFILVLLSLSITFFFRSIKTGKFEQIQLDNIVTYSFAEEEESKVKLEISATYKEAIDLNCSKIEIKTKHYNVGLKFMSWSFLLFIVHFVIEEVIRNVK